MSDNTQSPHFSQTSIEDYCPNFTQIPNIIFDYWIPKLRPNAVVILLVICRKTYGWHEDSEYISKNELCDLSGLSKNTVQAAIEELETSGILIKHQAKNKYGYLPNNYSLSIKKPKANIPGGSSQNLGEGRSNSDLGVGQILTPPIYKDIKKDIKKEDMGLSPISLPFGFYVKLKEGEYEKLCKDHGKTLIDEKIKELDDYIPNMPIGKRYKDHAAVLRSWIRRGDLKETQRSKNNENEKIAEEVAKRFELMGRKDLILGLDYIEFINGPSSENIGFSDKKFVERVDHQLRKRSLLPLSS